MAKPRPRMTALDAALDAASGATPRTDTPAPTPEQVPTTSSAEEPASPPRRPPGPKPGPGSKTSTGYVTDDGEVRVRVSLFLTVAERDRLQKLAAEKGYGKGPSGEHGRNQSALIVDALGLSDKPDA